MWNRRKLLTTAGLAAAGLAAGPPRLASAAPPKWGEYPTSAVGSMVPPELQAKKVLEIFMVGGVSPWETFYSVGDPAFGQDAGLFWWTFQEGPDSVAAWHQKCGNTGPLLQPWLQDKTGKLISLGPHLAGLRERKDIIDRTRVLITSHGLTPHDAAIPYTLTGAMLGSPAMAGLGAAVAHHQLATTVGPLAEPGAYVVAPPVQPLPSQPAFAIGGHPSAARPLAIYVSDNTAFSTSLKRESMGVHAAASDALLQNYIQSYKARLVHPGSVTTVRAPAYTDLAHAAAMLGGAKNYADVFAPKFFTAVADSSCAFTAPLSPTKMVLDLAVHLLQRPGATCRHVTAIEIGFGPNPMHYDTHWDHVAGSAVMHNHFWHHLSSLINKPGEANPAKINLNDTMIVINTEFGRTPGTQFKDGQNTGRNHWPQAYTTALIGGPIQKAQAGLRGAIDIYGQPIDAITPTQLRAATLAAMGIYPFEAENFAVGMVPGGNAVAASKWLRDNLLGLS